MEKMKSKTAFVLFADISGFTDLICLTYDREDGRDLCSFPFKTIVSKSGYQAIKLRKVKNE